MRNLLAFLTATTLLATTSLAEATLVNGDFSLTDPGPPVTPRFWNPVNSRGDSDNGNPIARVAGSPFALASISQTFTCDDDPDGGTICQVSFRYRFANAFAGTLTITGVNGAVTTVMNIAAPQNDRWHDATFQFDDPSCGNLLTLTFGVDAVVDIDDVEDACVFAAPSPAAGLTMATMFLGRLRRRKKA